MKQIIYKVPGGKLLKLKAHLDGNLLNGIEIRGDFFMYPEDGVMKIQDFLVGKILDEQFVNNLSEFIMSEGIEVFGFGAQDIYDALT
jgi:hypothetical protein